MDDPEAGLQAAERILTVLDRFGLDAVVIGAVALAAHNYVRATADIDLGVNASLRELRRLAEALADEGFAVEIREPGEQDPLSGVLDVSGPFGLIQVVNYGETFPAVIVDAIREATMVVREGSRLRLVPLPHLIALKVYAGGLKSKADIAALIERNPDLDLESVREVCRRYRLLRRFDAIRREIERPD